MGERELEAGDKDLLDVLALDVLSLLDLNNLQDVDRSEAGSVAGSHILVERVDGLTSGHSTVLLVHVVSTGARVVTDPHSKVLDLCGVLLKDLVDGHNLSGGLLDSAESSQEVPETRLGDHGVGSKDSHAVQLGLLLDLARETAANDLILVHACHGYWVVWNVCLA